MEQNIEIKARLSDFSQAIAMAKSISNTAGKTLKQTDYFFHCAEGRLKLRVFSDNKGELIFYRRQNQKGPKTSTYSITKTNEPNRLKLVLASAHGVLGIVKKTRHLFKVGRTRIHIDQVEQLGDYLELEVVLKPEESQQVGILEAEELMQQLSISEKNLIDCTYIDLISDKNQSQTDD
jgi:predicted adenylyl cyclase CyaB